MKRLIAITLAFALQAGSASAWTHGVAAAPPTVPNVIPGATQPAYDNSNSTASLTLLTNVNYANLTPTYHGSASDNGYSQRTWAQWNGPSLVFVSGVRHIGLFAAHAPTDVEKVAGLDSNVTDVKVRCDEGSWFTISAPSTDPDAGGVTDWNFTVDDANYPDGLHKCDAIIEPATGPDGLMSGPPFDVHGTGYAFLKLPQIWIDSGVRGSAGHILTIPAASTGALNFNGASVSSANASLGYGQSVTAYGVAAGTFIDGDATHSATNCVAETGANCTGGAGGSIVGTYHLTGPAQTVYAGVMTGKIDNNAGAAGQLLTVTAVIAPAGFGKVSPIFDGAGVTAGTIMDGSGQGGATCNVYTGAACTSVGATGTAHVNTSQLVSSTTLYATAPSTIGDQTSFYFSTNHNGTIARPTVYVCEGTCNGVTGSDSNTNVQAQNAATPLATIGKALAVAPALDAGTTFHKGKWGTTICLMNAGVTNTYSNKTNLPDAGLGYVDFQAANVAPCAATGDPGGEILSQSPQVTTRSYFTAHARWRYLNISTPPSNLNGGNAQYFVADHVTEIADAQGNSGLMGSGGWMCLESTVWFGSDGACSGSYMVRGTTAKYAYQDGFHDVPNLIGNTVEAEGYPAQWMTATYSASTPLIASNVTLVPTELAGYAPSQILNVGTVTYTMFSASGQNCYSGAGVATLASVNDGAKQVTFNTIGTTGNCADGATVYLSAIGAHPDDLQLSGSNIFNNSFIIGNNFNMNSGGAVQGEFIETELQDGLYVSGNSYKVNPIIGTTMAPMNGGNMNLINSHNTYINSGSFTHDLEMGGVNETLIGDQCLAGGSILPPSKAGVNIRAKAAATNACYTTTTP